MKRTWFLMLILLLSATGLSAQDDSPLVWLSANAGQLAEGQTAVITVNVSDAAAVYGGSFKLSYDPQALEVVLTENKAVTAGAFFADQPGFTLKNSADAQNGVVEYALTLTQPAEPVSGSGVIGTITVRALRPAALSATLTEGRLLSPEFSEVNGRRVARQINEITTRLQGIDPAASAPAVVSAPVVTTVPLVSAPAPVSSPNQLALLVGSGLFLLGLVLFAASLSTYSGLRRQYSRYQKMTERVSS